MTGAIVMTLFVLERVGWNPVDLFNQAADEHPEGEDYLAPGLNFTNPIDTISLGLALVLGTAGLPHILMRFFTVPDAKAARKSVLWAMGLIGAFYLMTTVARLRRAGDPRARAARRPRARAATWPRRTWRQELGGGAGTTGGDIFLAVDRRRRVRDDPRGGGRAS